MWAMMRLKNVSVEDQEAYTTAKIADYLKDSSWRDVGLNQKISIHSQ